MRIGCTVEGGRVVVALDGEFDLASAQAFRTEITQALQSGGVKDVVLEMSRVSFIDSSGLGAILGLYRRLAEAGGQVSIRNANAALRPLLELSGLVRIIPFEFKPSVRAAGEER